MLSSTPLGERFQLELEGINRRRGLTASQRCAGRTNALTDKGRQLGNFAGSGFINTNILGDTGVSHQFL